MSEQKCPVDTGPTLEPCGDPACLICRSDIHHGLNEFGPRIPIATLTIIDDSEPMPPLVAGGQGRSAQALKDAALGFGVCAVCAAIFIYVMWALVVGVPKSEPKPTPARSTRAQVWLAKGKSL